MLTGFDLSVLGDLGLFKGLNPRQLEWLSGRLHYCCLQPNREVLTVDQPGEVVYMILRGTVKIHVEQADGTDVILAILGRGDTLGEISLIDSAGRSASAVTLEETRLVWMDRPTFQEALQEMPSFTQNLVRILAARVRLANEQIQALATLDVYGRVSRQLLAFADKYGEANPNGDVVIPIYLTQGDIADLVGASRKRVNQVMVAFKSQELIGVNGEGRIVVRNRPGLARFCR